VAILGMALVLAAASIGLSLSRLLARQPTGPPGARLFRPPRSS